MGKQKETFQALGKAEILNDSDFFWIGSFLHHQPYLHRGAVGLATFEVQAQAGCAHAKRPLLNSVNTPYTPLPWPAPSSAFMVWSFNITALTRSRFCLWCSCLFPLSMHADWTHCKEEQSASPALSWVRGDESHTSTFGTSSKGQICQLQPVRRLVRNVLMWEWPREVR